jgi:hypothetical protein
MNLVFLGITIFAVTLTICLSIVENKRRKYEKEKLETNLKKFDNANRL